MTTARRGRTVYAIRVDGHLDDHWSDWLGTVSLTRHEDGTTTVRGPVADQAQLHGILAALGDIGATLLDLHTAEAPAPASAHQPSLAGTLHTERLTLRSATVEDAEPTWTYRRLPGVNEWLTGCPADLEGYRELFADPARLASTVIVQLGHDRCGLVIGDLMLRREDAWAQLDVLARAQGRQVELGWVLDPAHTGYGYGTEAVWALMGYCFEDLGVHRVHANCFLANDASWRLMQRVGLRREGHARRDALHRSGQWLDTVTYAALADEWRGSG